MYAGNTYQIQYVLEPENTKLPADFIYQSNSPSIASVNEDGIITANQAGTCIISGKSESKQINEQINVTVKEAFDLHATVVNSNDQYQQKSYNDLSYQNVTQESLWSWKNDKAISEIAILSGKNALEDVQVKFGDFVDEKGNSLNTENFSATFVKEATGFIGNAGWYSLNPDCIMPTGPKDKYFDILYDSKPQDMDSKYVQLVWLDFPIDRDAKSGVYRGEIEIVSPSTKQTVTISYELEVLNAVNNDSNEYQFRPDYWTYPFSTAEYYDVEPFSKEHLDILKEHLLQYKEYGGDTLTGTLIDEAWGGQTYGETNKEEGDIVRCPSLIQWTKKKDGSWAYDYTYFDKYVELANSVGLGENIVLYSPIPWQNQITYYSEAQGKTVKETVSPTNREKYASVWKPFLQDFADHLDEKGWFDKILLGFDERDDMKIAFDVIDEVKNKDGKVFRKQGACNNIYNQDGVPDRMENLSFNLNRLRSDIPAFKAFLEDRKEKGLKQHFIQEQIFSLIRFYVHCLQRAIGP